MESRSALSLSSGLAPLGRVVLPSRWYHQEYVCYGHGAVFVSVLVQTIV